MPDNEPGDSPDPQSRPTGGDIGRRVAQRREEIGLTREDVALRAGSAPGYLQYIEERAVTPGIGFLLRLANALETTVADLTGGGTDLPPGAGRAGYHPELVEMTVEECREQLSTHGVGRVAVSTADGPAIVPVNYLVMDDMVAYRTAPDAVPAAAADTEVAFEVDHIDDALSQGWSVLAVGPAHVVTDPEALRHLEEKAHTTPWAGGDRDLWVTITPSRLTGRRIHVRQTHAPSSGADPEASAS
ncbi:pyridoxamine 5'-phosphate oxidase family protein [Streptomyces sp. NPDC005283]|uniref:helix-turn-helix domain-containing protein n=1 Tax=unclassified Streptomyces TaxID=2593676 RepID=UPI0034517F75